MDKDKILEGNTNLDTHDYLVVKADLQYQEVMGEATQ